MKLPQFSLRDLFWLVLIVALVCAWWVNRPAVQKWEYRFIGGSGGVIQAKKELEKAGDEGWELAGTAAEGSFVYYVCKRPARSTSVPNLNAN